MPIQAYGIRFVFQKEKNSILKVSKEQEDIFMFIALIHRNVLSKTRVHYSNNRRCV